MENKYFELIKKYYSPLVIKNIEFNVRDDHQKGFDLEFESGGLCFISYEFVKYSLAKEIQPKMAIK